MTPTDEHPDPWPPLPYEAWVDTKRTLHRYTQIVGKIRMALVPPRNHWWHTTLAVTTRGLSTGPMPDGGRDCEIAFDLVAHELVVTTSTGGREAFALASGVSCADFYARVFAALSTLGVGVDINDAAFDLGDSPALSVDREHASYDADAVSRYWRVLAATRRVLDRFQGEWQGKSSPVQLFWHSFDLAHARYSGRPAAVLEGTDPITAEAYSREVIAFGFWPGDERTTPYPAFYSYTAPEPDGLADHALEPAAAAWTEAGAGHLAVLPYDDVRADADPDAALLSFLESAYRAGATSAAWDELDLVRPAAG